MKRPIAMTEHPQCLRRDHLGPFELIRSQCLYQPLPQALVLGIVKKNINIQNLRLEFMECTNTLPRLDQKAVGLPLPVHRTTPSPMHTPPILSSSNGQQIVYLYNVRSADEVLLNISLFLSEIFIIFKETSRRNRVSCTVMSFQRWQCTC